MPAMAERLEVWQEPAVGGVLNPAIFNLSGMDQIRAWDQGLIPAPPIARLTGFRISGAGEGTSSFTMPAHGWFANAAGVCSIGVLAVFADPPLGCAIQTTLPAATPYTTAELSLTALRPVIPNGVPSRDRDASWKQPAKGTSKSRRLYAAKSSAWAARRLPRTATR